MRYRPVVPVAPLRDAAEILGVSSEAARSALRHAGIRSGYPTELVEWLRDNRPGQGARTDLEEEETVKYYRIDFVNPAGRVVRSESFPHDDLAGARAIQRENAYREPRATGWTVTRSARTGGESERPGLHP